MTKFHSDEYVHFLKRVTPDTAAELSENGTKCWLPFYLICLRPSLLTTKKCIVLVGMDNPAYEGAFEFCSISAGGSISGAERLSAGSTDVAINWAGGLHHAKKNGASGFCYINDIVLGILELLRTFPRVLYVDIDCHHGDAVEEAFYTSERVLTCSLHKFGDFFPGTGLCDDRGVGRGFRYSINVPFRSGLSDASFHSVFIPVSDLGWNLLPMLSLDPPVNGPYSRSFPAFGRGLAMWRGFVGRR
jgi:histone deacetylase 1/2